MPLSVGLIYEAHASSAHRLSLLRDPLIARGDTVTTWAIGADASLLERARVFAQVARELPTIRPLHALAISGASRVLGLAGALARLGGVELVLDVSIHDRGRGRGTLDLLAGTAASRVVARDEASYAALLAAGVPAYRAGLVLDPLVFEPLVARTKELPLKARAVLHATAETSADAAIALDAIAAALATAPRLVAEVFVPAAEVAVARAALAGRELPVEIAASEGAPAARERAHLALVMGANAAAAGAAMAVGVPLVWAVSGRPYGIEGAAQVAPSDAAAIGAQVDGLIHDKTARAELAARGRAWDEELGWPAQSRLWLRAIDAACDATVVAQRRARQTALEGVKTGTRKA